MAMTLFRLQKDGNIVDILGYVNDTDYNKDVTLKRIDMTPSTSYDPAKFEVLEKDNWEDIGKVESLAVVPVKLSLLNT